MVKTLFGKMGERASGQNYIAEEHADPTNSNNLHLCCVQPVFASDLAR
jgi:hypothetical protein